MTPSTVLAGLWLVAQTPLPPEKPTAAPTVAEFPPYQAKIERLAEVMGTLSYMRDLCGAGDGTIWRDKMAALLATEGSTDARRDRLAGAFNRGLRDYQVSYRHCTPAAALVIERSLAEGTRLTQDLSNQFGG